MRKTTKRIVAAMTAAVIMTMSVSACTARTANDTIATSSSTSIDTTTAPAATQVDYANMSIDTVYGSQLPQYLNHQYTFDGEAVDINISNYYFIQTFGDMCTYASYYGMPMTSEGFIDLSASIYTDETAIPEGETNMTWGEYFVEFAENQLESALIFYKRAQEANLTLTQEQSAEIDTIFENISAQAEAGGVTLDRFLQIYFGDSCTEQSMRETMSVDYLKYSYMEYYADNYEFTEEELMIPNVRYVLFYAPNDGSMTEEQIAEQEANATALLEESEDVDLLQVRGALSYANGVAREYGDEYSVVRNVNDETFEAWAYDEAREVGQVGMIYSETFGYFVLGYLGEVEMPQDAKDELCMGYLSEEMRSILEENVYSFGTEDEYAPAQPVSASSESSDAVSEAISNVLEESVSGQTTTPDTGSGSGIPSWAVIVLIVAAVLLGIGGTVLFTKSKNGKREKQAVNPDDGKIDADDDSDTDSDAE